MNLINVRAYISCIKLFYWTMFHWCALFKISFIYQSCVFLQIFILLVIVAAVGIYVWTTRTHVKDFTLFAADIERSIMTGNCKPFLLWI